jgi:phosphatidylglycerophosphate synthase
MKKKNKSLSSILGEIKAGQKRPDGVFGSFMTRPVSHIFAYISFKMGLSPNLVSFLSFVFCVISVALLIFQRHHFYVPIVAALLWWFGAILDAADGDLARYEGRMSPFGGWFDSFLDRCKEFIGFSCFAYCAWIDYNSEICLLLGILAVFSNIMSGYITDTKKLFTGKRTPTVKMGKKYILGMVDTRDFFVVLSLFAGDMRIALWVYGTLFFVVVWAQIFMFCGRFGKE